MNNEKAQPESQRLAQARECYESSLEQYGSTIDALMWSGEESQQGRFEILMEIGDFDNASVLDVGCGFAHLCDLIESKYQNVSYTGLELTPTMAKAARERRQDIEIVEGSISELDSERMWDYVVESGIFNIDCYDFELTAKTLQEMYQHARKGVAANFLSRLSTGKFNETSSYFDPADLVKVASGLTRKFTLRHDYRANDFTLFLWRDEKSEGTENSPGEIRDQGIRRPKA